MIFDEKRKHRRIVGKEWEKSILLTWSSRVSSISVSDERSSIYHFLALSGLFGRFLSLFHFARNDSIFYWIISSGIPGIASANPDNSLNNTDDSSSRLYCLDHIVAATRDMSTIWGMIESSSPERVIWWEYFLIETNYGDERCLSYIHITNLGLLRYSPWTERTRWVSGDHSVLRPVMIYYYRDTYLDLRQYFGVLFL
jgi:hypothetical protein